MAWSIEARRKAALTPADVFAFYIEPATWGTWGHNVKWAHARGSVEAGAIVDVKAGYGKVYPVLVRGLVPARYVECEVRPPGMLVVNTYAVEPTDGGVEIRHGIEVSGRLSGITKLIQLDKVYTRWLELEIKRLIALAQERAAEPPASAEPGTRP